MEGDMKHLEIMLSLKGITNKKEIEAFVRMAIIRLKYDFINNENKIKECVKLLCENDGYIDRIDFYRIFDQKLFKKECAKIRRKLKES